jgi:hypothetical protein
MMTVILFLLGFLLLFYALHQMGFVSSMPNVLGARPVDKTLSNQYYIKNGVVTYCPNGNFLNQGSHPIKGADKDSFVVQAYQYAKDKNQAYFQDRPIDNADVQSFKVYPGLEVLGNKYLSCLYARDKAYAYYLNKVIANANPNSFKPLWGEYSRDENTLFYRGQKLLETSAVAEKVANDAEHEYLRLDNLIFYKDQAIEDVDMESFIIMGNGFAKDSRSIYFFSQRIEGVDAPNFKRVNQNHSRDNEHVYYHDEKIFKVLPGSDPTSFRPLNRAFSRDDNQVYHHSRILREVEVKTFTKRQAEEMENDPSLLLINYDDDHCAFIKRDRMVALSSQYYIYNNEIFAGNMRVKDASVDGFAVFDESGMYAKDKEHIFYRAYTVQGADMDSFAVINSSFAKDKAHVYFQEKRLQDVNPERFVYAEGMYGQAIDQHTALLVTAEE